MLTHWDAWLEAAEYYSKNFATAEDVVKGFQQVMLTHQHKQLLGGGKGLKIWHIYI
jgi:hypothetical protein